MNNLWDYLASGTVVGAPTSQSEHWWSWVRVRRMLNLFSFFSHALSLYLSVLRPCVPRRDEALLTFIEKCALSCCTWEEQSSNCKKIQTIRQISFLFRACQSDASWAQTLKASVKKFALALLKLLLIYLKIVSTNWSSEIKTVEPESISWVAVVAYSLSWGFYVRMFRWTKLPIAQSTSQVVLNQLEAQTRRMY